MTLFKFLLGLCFLALTQTTYAHNGKIAFAIHVNNITIDGNLNDWPTNISTFSVKEVVANPLDGKNDFNAQINLGYNIKAQSLYFNIEIMDDVYSKKDFIDIYINAAHIPNAPSMIVFSIENDALKMVKHTSAKDPIHQFLTLDDFEYKIIKKEGKYFFEGRLFLGKYIQENTSIGVDFMFGDVDTNQDQTTYINWDLGYGNGFNKEYNSGQLGDVVLTAPKTTFGQLEGFIGWKNEIEQPLPKKVRITSVINNKLYVDASIDSLNRYNLKLPSGNYYVTFAERLTNPLAGDGYFNQKQIKETNAVNIIIKSNMETKAGALQLDIVEPPIDKFKSKGVLYNFNDASKADVDAFIEAHMDYYLIPGVSLGLINNGKLVYHKNYGVQSMLTKKKIEDDNVFQAASVTKAVFAFVVNRLADRDVIDLDTPLYTLLPFKNIEHIEDYKLITARMVLSHQSGLPNWAWGGPSGWKKGRQTELLFKPGTAYGYSGEAFQYLHRVVEKVTGKDILTLIQEEVIEPLQMQPLYFKGNDKLKMVQGHLAGNPTYWDMALEPGVAHSMLTEAKTFSEFVAALSNRKGLSEEQYDAMFKRIVKAKGFESPNNSYWDLGLGLGFFVEDTHHGKAIMHGGSNWDFQSEFVLFTEKKMGFVIFTNSNTGHKLSQELEAFLMRGKN
ncbi:serine hydrolase domain-containing protein [Cochleicola gelatinilyticus]|uniref:Uncharacterized protein n=1 Tax=Cochleicola gelatinilyticus TaxID=1763537 RepID=A0A167GX11_9FLAO|nr:serine hydrolase domain-containing protein [Cochleicola gelatinilyticus]OAB77992.1 hypothetical protein ULVI_10915 [Cochleicola gelatinilyticus]